MDLPDLVFDADHINVLAIIVVSFTVVMPQRFAQVLKQIDGPSKPDQQLNSFRSYGGTKMSQIIETMWTFQAFFFAGFIGLTDVKLVVYNFRISRRIIGDDRGSLEYS